MGAGLRRAFGAIAKANDPDTWKSCKIGTMPAYARVHGKDKIEVGNWIRIKECPGDEWHRVLVRQVNPDGYFQADR
jgi:hypothetical protein